MTNLCRLVVKSNSKVTPFKKAMKGSSINNLPKPFLKLFLLSSLLLLFTVALDLESQTLFSLHQEPSP